MSFAIGGVTHCMNCMQPLGTNNVGLCDACAGEEEEERQRREKRQRREELKQEIIKEVKEELAEEYQKADNKSNTLQKQGVDLCITKSGWNSDKYRVMSTLDNVISTAMNSKGTTYITLEFKKED